ncbi:hypothetical protein BDK51DRAFT_29097, partial [Blyttiomyces helicus]
TAAPRPSVARAQKPGTVPVFGTRLELLPTSFRGVPLVPEVFLEYLNRSDGELQSLGWAAERLFRTAGTEQDAHVPTPLLPHYSKPTGYSAKPGGPPSSIPSGKLGIQGEREPHGKRGVVRVFRRQYVSVGGGYSRGVVRRHPKDVDYGTGGAGGAFAEYNRKNLAARKLAEFLMNNVEALFADQKILNQAENEEFFEPELTSTDEDATTPANIDAVKTGIVGNNDGELAAAASPPSEAEAAGGSVAGRREPPVPGYLDFEKHVPDDGNEGKGGSDLALFFLKKNNHEGSPMMPTEESAGAISPFSSLKLPEGIPFSNCCRRGPSVQLELALEIELVLQLELALELELALGLSLGLEIRLKLLLALGLEKILLPAHLLVRERERNWLSSPTTISTGSSSTDGCLAFEYDGTVLLLSHSSEYSLSLGPNIDYQRLVLPQQPQLCRGIGGAIKIDLSMSTGSAGSVLLAPTISGTCYLKEVTICGGIQIDLSKSTGSAGTYWNIAMFSVAMLTDYSGNSTDLAKIDNFTKLLKTSNLELTDSTAKRSVLLAPTISDMCNLEEITICGAIQIDLSTSTGSAGTYWNIAIFSAAMLTDISSNCTDLLKFDKLTKLLKTSDLELIDSNAQHLASSWNPSHATWKSSQSAV